MGKKGGITEIKRNRRDCEIGGRKYHGVGMDGVGRSGKSDRSGGEDEC